MSARTKLIAFGFLLAALPTVSGVSLLATSRKIETAQQKTRLTEELEQQVFNLTLLTNEFTRFRASSHALHRSTRSTYARCSTAQSAF